jgi:hypothetical protein
MMTALTLQMLGIAAKNLPGEIVRMAKQPTIGQDFDTYYGIDILKPNGDIKIHNAAHIKIDISEKSHFSKGSIPVMADAEIFQLAA